MSVKISTLPIKKQRGRGFRNAITSANPYENLQVNKKSRPKKRMKKNVTSFQKFSSKKSRKHLEKYKSITQTVSNSSDFKEHKRKFLNSSTFMSKKKKKEFFSSKEIHLPSIYKTASIYFKSQQYSQCLTTIETYFEHIDCLDIIYDEDLMYKLYSILIPTTLKLQEFEKCVTFVTIALNNHPMDEQLYQYRANAYYKMGNFQKAGEEFEKYLKLAIPTIDVLNDLARCKTIVKDYVKAIKYYSILINLFKKKNSSSLSFNDDVIVLNERERNLYASAMFQRGMSYQMMNDITNAKLDFCEVLKIDVEFLRTKEEIALEMEKKNDVQNALQMYLDMLKIDPNNFFYFVKCARLFMLSGKKSYPKAIKMYTKAIDQYNDNNVLNLKKYELYEKRGWLYEKVENVKSSIMDFTTALEINKDSFVGYRRRGLLLLKNEKEEKAKVDFNNLIELNKRIKKDFNRNDPIERSENIIIFEFMTEVYLAESVHNKALDMLMLLFSMNECFTHVQKSKLFFCFSKQFLKTLPVVEKEKEKHLEATFPSLHVLTINEYYKQFENVPGPYRYHLHVFRKEWRQFYELFKKKCEGKRKGKRKKK